MEDRVSKYGLKPISIGFFGGIIDFNRMGFLTRKGMEAAFKAPLQKHRFKETASGAYDLRDWDEIRSWAKELANKAREWRVVDVSEGLKKAFILSVIAGSLIVCNAVAVGVAGACFPWIFPTLPGSDSNSTVPFVNIAA
ncbi:MAG: hypothetical protein ACQXXL_07100 [Candidatus Methanosuratincola sp.]